MALKTKSTPKQQRQQKPSPSAARLLGPRTVSQLDGSDSDVQVRLVKARRMAMNHFSARDEPSDDPLGTSQNPFPVPDSSSDGSFDEMHLDAPILPSDRHYSPRDIDDWTLSRSYDRLLEVFPDIDKEFVSQHYDECMENHEHGESLLAEMIGRISDLDEYPKREKVFLLLPSSDPNDPVGCKWGDPPWPGVPKTYEDFAMAILTPHFPDLSINGLKATVRQCKSFYGAWVKLEDPSNAEYVAKIRIQSSRANKSYSDLYLSCALGSKAYGGRTLGDEFAAARKEVAKRTAIVENASTEARNLEEAKAKGLMGECACCFDDEVPLNRLAYCSAASPHAYCYACIKKNTETTLGKGQCRPTCVDTSGCRASIEMSQLQKCLDAPTLTALQRKQQVDEVKQACPDIADCPFCDYMEECPPADIDREFVCQNAQCAITSCRLCREPSHIPLKCDEWAAKRAAARKLEHRHTIAEAMTEALVRTCNTCNNRFVKEYGCNKMRCPKCSSLQCYVCGISIEGYEHFGSGDTKCLLHDDFGVEVRHIEEVKKAEETIQKKLREENTDLADVDLEIKVSKEVADAEAKRVELAKASGARGNPANPYPGWNAAQENRRPRPGPVPAAMLHGGIVAPARPDFRDLLRQLQRDGPLARPPQAIAEGVRLERERKKALLDHVLGQRRQVPAALLHPDFPFYWVNGDQADARDMIRVGANMPRDEQNAGPEQNREAGDIQVQQRKAEMERFDRQSGLLNIWRAARLRELQQAQVNHPVGMGLDDLAMAGRLHGVRWPPGGQEAHTRREPQPQPRPQAQRSLQAQQEPRDGTNRD